ncbi:MAG: hypothetical protein JKY52_00335 [Flavobacteriales bacterium]|nr:hypothetical protein [Flavobacteriales bacterium]
METLVVGKAWMKNGKITLMMPYTNKVEKGYFHGNIMAKKASRESSRWLRH